MKNEIINTTYNHESLGKDDEGDIMLISWLEINAIYNSKEITCNIQHDCGTSYDILEYEEVDIHDEFRDFLDEEGVFELLKYGDAETIKEVERQELVDSDDFGEIEALASSINKILDNKTDYLTLAAGLHRGGINDIGYAMCSLQISFGYTQDESRRICDLFI